LNKITSWGSPGTRGVAPSDSGYTKIYSTYGAFAALKADGTIVAWANSRFGGEGAPSDSGYTKIYSTGSAFAAIKADGSVTTWGLFRHVGTPVPTPNIANTGGQIATIDFAITDITFNNSGDAITTR
jgi:hypothetical protein